MSVPANILPSLPTELWRCILRWCTYESNTTFSSGSPVPFGWPYRSALGASFFRSVATKRNLLLVSRRFSDLAAEFFYETLHFRRAEQVILLAEQCKSNHKLVDSLRIWTRILHVTPVFGTITTDEELVKMTDYFRSMLEIVRMCSGLRYATIQVDSVTLFHDPTYRSWVEILGALSPELQHLAVVDFLLGPVIWKPRLFSTSNSAGVNLRTLRLDAEHAPFEHRFPHLTHLWLFSWLTASMWDMPSLTHLYIEYFSDSGPASSFWRQQKPRLKLLHFGGETDFGLYFADLPQRLRDCTPNLEELEYHYAGDLNILWDPSELSPFIRRVAVRLEGAEGRGAGGDASEDYPLASTSPMRRSRNAILQYTHAGFGILLELLTELYPSNSHRWDRIERHLERYSSSRHPAKLYVLIPRHAVALLRLEDPPSFIPTTRDLRFPGH